MEIMTREFLTVKTAVQERLMYDKKNGTEAHQAKMW